jgi:hypothetical protein
MAEPKDPEKAQAINARATAAAQTLAQQVNPTGTPIDDPLWDRFNQPAPYPGAAPGTAEYQANADQQIANQKNYSGYLGAVEDARESGGWEQQLALALNLAAVTAGVGAAFAPAATASVEGATVAVEPSLGATALAGAETGAVSGAVKGALTGGNIAKDVAIGGLLGGAGGALSSEAKGLTGNLTEAGVNPTLASNVVNVGEHALTGAVGGEISGKGALGGAESGAIGGAVGSAVKDVGLTGPAAGIAGSELTSLIGSTLTSPTGHSATATSSSSSGGLSPGIAPLAAAGVGAVAAPAMSNIQPINTGGDPTLNINAAPTSSTGGTSSLLGDIGAGVSSTLGGGSLGNILGSVSPYAAVGAIGLAQAKAGEAQDAKYSQQQQTLAQPAITQSNTLLGNYNAGTINPTDQSVVNTETAQGNQVIQSATGLSQIAQTAFASYNSGQLEPAQQIQLDQTVAAQKQQVAQQLSSAGITDSTILAAQYQQIDNNAIISKQNLLNSNFNTGSAAYNQWLTATTQGQQTIQDAQKFASTSLQTELANSMAEANIGIGEVNTAIQTQMTTDANYAAQVSQLLGTLATAYAKQVAGQKAAGTTGSPGTVGGPATGTGTGSGLTENQGGATGGIASPGQLSDATNAEGSLDPTLSGDISGLTIPATAGNATDISSYGASLLGDTSGTDLANSLGDVIP